MIDAGTFERYAAALDANADLLEAAVGELEGELSGVPAASLPDALGARYASLVMTYGASAAAVAVDFYASLRELSGAESGYEPSQADAQDAALLLWDARSILDTAGGDLRRALPSLSGRAVQRAMERADSTLVDNAARDPAHPKWALVPHAGACGWCVMIASNGFMYHTRAKAAKARHANCRCRPVVDFDTESPALEGYSPKTMRGAYRDCRAAVEDDAKAKWEAMSPEERAKYGGKRRGAYDHYLRNRISAEMSTRDRAWLQTGQSGTMELGTRSIERHEFSAYRVLASHGFSFRVNPVDEKARWGGKASPDVTLSGKRWELKCPAGANPKKTISRNLNKAVEQMRNADPPAKSMSIILSAMETPLSSSQVEYQVLRKMDEGVIDEIIVVYSEMLVKRYSKA